MIPWGLSRRWLVKPGAEAQQRFDPVAGELGADSRIVGHGHVRILTFRCLPEQYDDS
jgi:hypothetical protein